MVDDLFGGMGPAVEPPKPTPGPWRVYECPDTGRLWIETADGERLMIADVTGDGETIEGEEYANARLLAAAPELLEASTRASATLLSLVQIVSEHGSAYLAAELNNARRQLLAALAKARGEGEE